MLARFRTREEISRTAWEAAGTSTGIASPAAPQVWNRARRFTMEMDFAVIAALDFCATGSTGTGIRSLDIIKLLNLGLKHEVQANTNEIRTLLNSARNRAKARNRARLLEACNELMNGALDRYRELGEKPLTLMADEDGRLDGGARTGLEPARRAFPDDDERESSTSAGPDWRLQ